MKNIHILYSSTSGNTRIVVQKIVERLKKNDFNVTFDGNQKTTQEQLVQADALIFANPTYNHGELEPKMRDFLPTLQGVDLTKKPCAVVALGDAAYDSDYCAESRHILTDFLVTHNAVPIVQPLTILGAPIKFLSTFVPTWTQQFINNLQNYDHQKPPYRVLRGRLGGQWQYRKNVSASADQR